MVVVFSVNRTKAYLSLRTSKLVQRRVRDYSIATLCVQTHQTKTTHTWLQPRGSTRAEPRTSWSHRCRRGRSCKSRLKTIIMHPSLWGSYRDVIKTFEDLTVHFNCWRPFVDRSRGRNPPLFRSMARLGRVNTCSMFSCSSLQCRCIVLLCLLSPTVEEIAPTSLFPD